jgi:hypothetical protein
MVPAAGGDQVEWAAWYREHRHPAVSASGDGAGAGEARSVDVTPNDETRTRTDWRRESRGQIPHPH